MDGVGLFARQDIPAHAGAAMCGHRDHRRPPLPPPLPPPPPLPSLRPPPPPTAIGKLSGLGVKRGHERDLAPPLTRGGGGASGVVILPNAIEALASPVLEQNKSWAGEHLCFFSCR